MGLGKRIKSPQCKCPQLHREKGFACDRETLGFRNCNLELALDPDMGDDTKLVNFFF